MVTLSRTCPEFIFFYLSLIDWVLFKKPSSVNVACVTRVCVCHGILHHPSSSFHAVRMRQEVRMTWPMIPNLRWVHRCEETETGRGTERGREKGLVGKMHMTMVSLHICLSWLLCEDEETQQACLLSVVCCRRTVERSLSAGAQAGDCWI